MSDLPSSSGVDNRLRRLSGQLQAYPATVDIEIFRPRLDAALKSPHRPIPLLSAENLRACPKKVERKQRVLTSELYQVTRSHDRCRLLSLAASVSV